MKIKRITAFALATLLASPICLTACKKGDNGANGGNQEVNHLALSYSFDETTGNMTRDAKSGMDYKIEYVFNAENQQNIYKPSNDPLRKTGVSGKALYMDGFSTCIANEDYETSTQAITLSAWVAPRGFENLPNYDGDSMAGGQPCMTSIINKGNIAMGEGFLLGYGRLGLWGIQLALESAETGEQFVIAFYDPINALPLYEWSHVSVSYDGETGYIGLFYNGEKAYEAVIPELTNTSIIDSAEPLYVGRYASPINEKNIDRQYIAGLLDEVRIFDASLSPKAVKAEYAKGQKDGAHPVLNFVDVGLDSSVYAGDRYRPQYHAIPPAVWMNEPHSPFYYKGRYHVFYQHNPCGPYWSQIRWGHIVSDDMIHWEYVKDAVAPTAGICPEGVWTGGAVIGPDGTPWLAITAGTNTSTWSGQNIAFAHAADPDDPNLTDWVVEDKLVITHPNDDSQGRREQFRDPFVWYDDGTYYMMVSTSTPHGGGSANIYISKDMREWEYKGYVFECDYGAVPEQGRNWECVVMFPITTKDGSQTKWILFDCPQYEGSSLVVECYYWIGTFDKQACRFIPEHLHPKLFDSGKGIYTGQNGFCYLTEEDIAQGKTTYEQGRTIMYAIAQGKDADTAHNVNSGWAHNFAIPLEIWLADNGTDVIREPIKEIESLYKDVLYSYEGEGLTATQVNENIKNVRGDTLRIDMQFEVQPNASEYESGLYVRYNPTSIGTTTERTKLAFAHHGVYIDRKQSSVYTHVVKEDGHVWPCVQSEYTVTILLDRSMLEVYVNGIMSFTTRIYPKYGDSDYLRLFETNSSMKVKKMTIRSMKGAFVEDFAPPYYGNVGNLADLL